MPRPKPASPFRNFQLVPKVVRLVWIYFRFLLSLRILEDPLDEREFAICHETARP